MKRCPRSSCSRPGVSVCGLRRPPLSITSYQYGAARSWQSQRNTIGAGAPRRPRGRAASARRPATRRTESSQRAPPASSPSCGPRLGNPAARRRPSGRLGTVTRPSGPRSAASGPAYRRCLIVRMVAGGLPESVSARSQARLRTSPRRRPRRRSRPRRLRPAVAAAEHGRLVDGARGQPRGEQLRHARRERDSHVHLRQAEPAAVATHHALVVGEREHRAGRVGVALHGGDRAARRSPDHAGEHLVHARARKSIAPVTLRAHPFEVQTVREDLAPRCRHKRARRGRFDLVQARFERGRRSPR